MTRFGAYAPRFALIAGGACVLLILVPILVRTSVAGAIAEDPNDLAPAQAVLVLGASVISGRPSPILAERADAAIALYRAERAKRILVSGDNGEESYDEVRATLAYLVEQGIPARDIFLDYAGFDTYSSIYRARYVFGARTLIIVTQDFHLPRALMIARVLGIDAAGTVAGGGGRMRDYVREIPATLKALIDVVSGREPKYLGAPIPLAGEGNAVAVLEAARE